VANHFGAEGAVEHNLGGIDAQIPYGQPTLLLYSYLVVTNIIHCLRGEPRWFWREVEHPI